MAHQPNLRPTTAGIIDKCDRFRILVLGKSGAGKSKLINRVFGIESTKVSHMAAGEADIDKEFSSDVNPRFVLHDSQGFEPGETNNFQIVKDFIARRSKAPELKDRLHAIWLCIEIPHAGGRAFEQGDEEFLRLHLGIVPIIVVFTKYDALLGSVEKDADDTNMTEEEFEASVKAVADTIYDEICMGALKKVTNTLPPEFTVIPNARVSVKGGYDGTILELIQITQDNVLNAADPISDTDEPASEAVMWAIAQRQNAEVKIEASIQVGKTKYWRGLAASAHFPKHTLKDCLEVVHEEIVTVWNFYDPNSHLNSRQFKALMSRLVEDLADPSSSSSRTGLNSGISGIAGVAGIVTAISGPAAPIVVPIAAAFVLAKWVYDLYQETTPVLRRLMAYIVDLTMVMQSIFWLMDACGHSCALSRRHIKIAFNVYMGSAEKAEIHDKIHKHVAGSTVRDRMNEDHALGEVTRLIKGFDPTETFKRLVQDQVVPIDGTVNEEPWD